MKDYDKSSYFFENINNYDKIESSEKGHKELIKETLKQIKTKPKNILEFGAGTGLLTQEVKKLFPHTELVLIEPDKEAHSLLKVRAPKSTIHKINAENFSSKEKFDLIIGMQAYHHVKEQDKLLKNLKKHLKDNGTIIVSDVFLQDYKNEGERIIAINHSLASLFDEYKEDIKVINILNKIKKALIEKKGEYKISTQIFVTQIKNAGLKIKDKLFLDKDIVNKGGKAIYLLTK